LSQERLGVYGWHRDEMSASARMNQYERGKHVPDISIVEKFAEVLNLASAFFYATDDDFAQLLCHFHRLSDAEKKRFLSKIVTAESDQ
jgi:transcriptional regulator with XRE-family HTH domain